MLTLCPAASTVKPAPPAVMTDAEFSAWCARQWSSDPSPASCEFADDADDSVIYEPTFTEQCAELGRTVGLTGSTNGFFELFPHATDQQARTAGIAYTSALKTANREHAKQVGFDLGCDGKSCLRPGSVNRRFHREFVAGWEAGLIERAEREREMAAYFQQLDWEHQHEIEEREIEAFNREMFSGRCPFTAMD